MPLRHMDQTGYFIFPVSRGICSLQNDKNLSHAVHDMVENFHDMLENLLEIKNDDEKLSVQRRFVAIICSVNCVKYSKLRGRVGRVRGISTGFKIDR